MAQARTASRFVVTGWMLCAFWWSHSAPALGEDWFVESAKDRGLRAIHRSGAAGEFYFPEIMCGGAAWLDYDGDGDLDFYLVQAHRLGDRSESNAGNQLFRNDGGQFTDVSAGSGANHKGYGNGVACGDYDNDGDVDIYVNNFGANALLRNNGDGTFGDVTAQAGVGDPRWSVSSVFLDYDGDGDLDLFVANYVVWSVATRHPCFGPGGIQDYCGPQSYNRPERDTLYRNNGDGTFTDVTDAVGMGSALGNGLGVVAGDFDRDGRTDVYVANDQVANHVWINKGGKTFVEDSLMMGCAVNEMGRAEAGMGVAAADYDNDGDLDLFMVHLSGETNTFYRFDGGMFEDVTSSLGLGGPSVPYTGFGVGFFDFDNDGRLDVFVGNGRVTVGALGDREHPFAEPNQLYRQNERGRFEDVTKRSGRAFGLVETTRGSVFGDFDNDGDIDVATINMDGPVRLLENRSGQDRHWIGVRAVDRHGRDAYGALVTVRTERGPRVRTVQPAYSYASSNDPRVLVGLGDSSEVQGVSVRWPTGRTEYFDVRRSDRYVDLHEGSGVTGAPGTDDSSNQR